MRTYHPASVLDLTNAVVADWEEISATRLQNLEENLRPEEWRLLEQKINAQDLGITCSTITNVNEMFRCPHTLNHVGNLAWF